jgi:NADH:ubiquinone oxidoreductase subunit F (NADH-binding)
MQVHRILDPRAVPTLAAYERSGGGRALAAAREVDPAALRDVVGAAGLRGRGGAGFPTGRKWQTVVEEAQGRPVTVVVNAAEGEPGTLKDRTLLRRNPFQVLEGALIAALAVGADRVVVGLKRSAGDERRRVDEAIAQLAAAGWSSGVTVECIARSDRYLLGEETALLEVVDGRPPFPRVAPPYRAGIDDAHPVSLVNNVETLANVPRIVHEGPEPFRALGTAESPGTMVCTVSGRTPRAGVGEVELGTPLHEVLERLGGVARRDVVAVLSGTANPILPAAALDAPVSWEGLAAAGGGLGSAGFIVIDRDVDIVAVAHGVSHFLSIESCGQCTPCKQDGLALASLLDRVRSSALEPGDGEPLLADLAGRVTDGARCFLAQQHQAVVLSLLTHFPEALAAHLEGRADAAEPFPIVALDDIVDGEAVLALDELDLAPDWADGSAESPSDRIDVRAR